MRLISAHIAHKLRAHACWWSGLREVTVPSAAVSDADCELWSREMYARDLADQPALRTGETS